LNLLKNSITILFEDTFNITETFSQYRKAEYIYEVRFLVVNDLRGNNSVINNEHFKKFVANESNNMKNKKYDSDINIRDLYPIEIHLEGKREEDIKRFNILNNQMLEFSPRISRRVTKKEIVFKRDKIKSIVAISFSRNYKCLRLFLLPSASKFDINKKFITVPKNSKRTLDMKLLIRNEYDFEYAKNILNKYLEETLC